MTLVAAEPRARSRERGFTLIELMVSLLVSSLLVVLLLGILHRMSFAFHQQQQLTAVQQVLAGARRSIELDAKQAGYQLAQGFTIAADGAGPAAVKHSPLRIRNSSTGPDEIAFFYADGEREALVTSSGPATTVTVDDASGFSVDDLVVLSTVDTNTMFNPISPVLEAKIATYSACVVQIAAIDGTQITFAQSGDWGRANNDHCAPTTANVTRLFGFVAHAWRIDPSRPADGVLQLDETGRLLATPRFEDYATGVTDLQVATYFYDADGSDTDDPGGDPDRDWYSSDQQTTWTSDIAPADSFVAPLMVSISVVARTTDAVEGIASAATPRLTELGNVDNNPVGDRDSVSLPSATDPALAGKYLFRSTTFAVDLRNLGVGR